MTVPERRRAPYENDGLVARYPAGTDPRMALRDAMGAFMQRTDGSNDLPWWLHAEYRWWHAGPMGLKRGDEVLPPSETGVMPLINSDPNMVYVTSDRTEAIVYATFQIGRTGRLAQLYEVSFSTEPIHDDTQPESQTSFRVPRATVRRIEAPSRRELEMAMAEIVEAEAKTHEPEKAEIDPFDDDTPITGQCDLENPESCESCT